MKFLVVERVVDFCDIDLFPRLLDTRHLVGHPSSLLNILWIGQIPVRPVRCIKGPSYTVEPDRLVCQFLRNLLGSKYSRCSTVSGRTHVQSFDGPADALGVHDVVDSYLGAQLRATMIDSVSLVLHCDACALLLRDSVLVHVSSHLPRENPQHRCAERPL